MEIDSWPLRDLVSTAQMVATLAFSREGEQLHYANLAFRAGLRVALPLCFLSLGLIGDCCIFNGELLRQSCVGFLLFNSALGRDSRVKMAR